MLLYSTLGVTSAPPLALLFVKREKMLACSAKLPLYASVHFPRSFHLAVNRRHMYTYTDLELAWRHAQLSSKVQTTHHSNVDYSAKVRPACNFLFHGPSVWL